MIKCKCGKKAIWLYGPADADDVLDYCDDCVPRKPCSCNFSEETNDYEKDELGRHQPCADYMYSEKGFLTDKEFDLEFNFIEVILQSISLFLTRR